MIRRIAFVVSAVLLATVWPGACVATPSRSVSIIEQMREAVMALRGLIDREGASHFFVYPRPRGVQPGHLGGWWPVDPWTGANLSPGTGRGHYLYTVSTDRRRYRLVGFLDNGRRIVLSGGMPLDVRLAFDHRSEEGVNLIRQYVENYADAHDGIYPQPSEVRADGAVATQPTHRYWPSNPWTHRDMAQGATRGSFTYCLAPDRTSYTLILHRDLKRDYVLIAAAAPSPWEQLLTTLEDEILRHSGRILASYIDRYARQHGGKLPPAAAFSPFTRLGARPEWPQDPTNGGPLRPGTAPGTYSYVPGFDRRYTLIVHLHAGDFRAGGNVPSAPARNVGEPRS